VIVLVRHGRTDHNAAGRLLGRLDPPLDELGVRQAAALAAALADLRDPLVVTSPLARARATAAALQEGLGVPATVDERWTELDYGEWDGRPLADVPPATWRTWRSDAGFRPPGGETLAELGLRVRAAMADLTDLAARPEAEGRDLVVVSHVSPIKAAVAWALGVGDELAWRLFVAPASITRIRAGGTPSLHGFNEVGHLRALGPSTSPPAAPR
jgi:broad specificity phosphatase PhoE